MKIVAMYDFKGGKKAVEKRYPQEFKEIKQIITSIDSTLYKTKKSKEKTMKGKMLFSPRKLNKAFKAEFAKRHWKNYKVKCNYAHGEYLTGYVASKNSKHIQPFREMDFVKHGTKLGVEVQFGDCKLNCVTAHCSIFLIIKEMNHEQLHNLIYSLRFATAPNPCSLSPCGLAVILRY